MLGWLLSMLPMILGNLFRYADKSPTWPCEGRVHGHMCVPYLYVPWPEYEYVHQALLVQDHSFWNLVH